MKKVFIDMDGVIANFDGQPNAIQRFAVEKGFFLKIKPLPFAAKLNKALESVALREHTYILSASPTERGDEEKIKWLAKYVPNLKPQNIIIVRGGHLKKHYAGFNRILVDDYSENIKEWNENGGVGVKFLNGTNGKSKKWNEQNSITANNELYQLFLGL